MVVNSLFNISRSWALLEYQTESGFHTHPYSTNGAEIIIDLSCGSPGVSFYPDKRVDDGVTDSDHLAIQSRIRRKTATTENHR